MTQSACAARYEGYVLPASIRYLQDNAFVHDLIDELRWNDEPHCPRCTSRYAKRVNTTVFRQLYRCTDCAYMFNSLSGTIFHGAKMPLYKFLQFFVLRSALSDDLELREICYALDISHKTASILKMRADELPHPGQLATVDRNMHTSLQASAGHGTAENDRFFSYCGMKAILADPMMLAEYVGTVARDEAGMRASQ